MNSNQNSYSDEFVYVMNILIKFLNINFIDRVTMVFKKRATSRLQVNQY